MTDSLPIIPTLIVAFLVSVAYFALEFRASDGSMRLRMRRTRLWCLVLVTVRTVAREPAGVCSECTYCG